MELEKEIRIKERVEEVILNKELVLESYSIDENKNNDIINNIKESDTQEDDDEEFLKIIDPDFLVDKKMKKLKRSSKTRIGRRKRRRKNRKSCF
ncbi:Uncharacterised protein [Fusobacterium varium]|nr:hypothetical protein [Fusobacterium varium]VEH38271.1 Uncharacterised protein [Fusobacterium varium]